MKIAVDARFFGTETGIGRYAKELVEGLEKTDSVNNYVIFLAAKNFDLYRPANPNFQKKLADIKWYSWEEQMKMGRVIDAERADLVHFPHFNVPFFCRTPYVLTIHDLILRHFPMSAASTKNPAIFYLKYFFYNLILWRAIRRAKKIIVPSYFVKNDIIKNFKINPDKIRVVSEGLSNLPRIDLGEEYLKTKNIISPYLLYVGNCYPHKNLEKLIEAFEILKKENPELKLVLVGKQNYFSQRLQSSIKNHQSSIIFYGYASDEELATLYKHASLYVFPSLMEGFGLPPLEALSFGLPVVCSDIPVFHEVLNGAAAYFNPKDAEDMANAISAALQDAEKRNKILTEGNKVLLRYNNRHHSEETLEVYNAARDFVQRRRSAGIDG